MRLRNAFDCSSGCSLFQEKECSRFPMQVLLTCRQIHDEAQLVIYHDNTWGVELPAITPHQLTNIMMFNAHLLDLSRRHLSARNIRFLDFPMHLAPSVKRFLTPEEVSGLRDADRTLAVDFKGRAYIMLTEAVGCERYRSILIYLVTTHWLVFPELQSITISINWHPPWVADPDPFCHCLKFLVRLNRQDNPPSDDSSRMQGFEDIGPYEPRRRLLAPLALLANLRNIEVQLQADPAQVPITDISITPLGPSPLRSDAPSHDALSDNASGNDVSSDDASDNDALSDDASSNDTSISEASQKEEEAPRKEPRKENPVWTFSTVEQMLNAAGENFVNFISS